MSREKNSNARSATRSGRGLAALLACMTLLASGAAASGELKVGLVADLAGIDDRSYNAAAWDGLQRAQRDLGVVGAFNSTRQPDDYVRGIEDFLDRRFSLIITAGYRLSAATRAAALAHPAQKFAIVDDAFDPALPNVLGIVFQTDEAAFLAGYLAAGMSKTGKVGTFGGVALPPVTIFMVGFENGVRYYNRRKGKNVALLGWRTDPAVAGCGSGLFTGNFENIADGRRFATRLLDDGADVVLPVAGPVGQGSAAVIGERGMMMIGVDADQYVSSPEFRGVFLTSVTKNIGNAVHAVVKSVVSDGFKGGSYTGSLRNDGVGIAPFHDFEARVPAELKTEINQLRQDIIDGKVTSGWSVCNQ